MTGSVEIVYRGIFQTHLGQHITRGIVLAARKEGKVGISFGRYGDSPERNGIPAKSFAVVADTAEPRFCRPSPTPSARRSWPFWSRSAAAFAARPAPPRCSASSPPPSSPASRRSGSSAPAEGRLPPTAWSRSDISCDSYRSPCASLATASGGTSEFERAETSSGPWRPGWRWLCILQRAPGPRRAGQAQGPIGPRPYGTIHTQMAARQSAGREGS